MNSGYLYVLSCYALVGISYPIAKDAMNDIPTWIFTSVTFLIGLLALLPLAWSIDKTQFRKLPAMAWLSISVQSLLGAVLYTVFLLYSFTYASAIAGAVFTSLAPAAVLILSALFLKERLSTRKLIAIGLAISGVLTLTLPASEGGETTVLGIILLLLSTLSSASCVIAANRLDVKLPAITMATGVCFTGFIFSLPMAASEAGSFHFASLGGDHALTLVYYGLLVWAAPYVCFFKGVTRIPASATGMAFAVIPVAATIVSVAFYGESLTMTSVLALVMVTCSVLLAESQADETPEELAHHAGLPTAPIDPIAHHSHGR